MSFATVDYSPERVWSEEKERELALLEQRLFRANKNWSDEQEDVLPMVCAPHREVLGPLLLTEIG
jgi:hypothetical protein